jgi:transportin-3
MHSVEVLERLCRCWRYMVLTYRTDILPILPVLAQQLASGFETSRQGCFLWATEAVLREFSTGSEYVDPQTSQAIYSFFEQQAFAFLKVMNDLPPHELPDVIDDFFRLLDNVLIYYHDRFVPAAICSPIFTAAISALSLEQQSPVTATLHFIRDLLSYGSDSPNFSQYGDDYEHPPVSPAVQQAVRSLLSSQGEQLVQRILTGMMFSFPRDCLQDASGVLLAQFEMMSAETAQWVQNTVSMLPAGSVKQGELEKLMVGIGERVQQGNTQRVRVLLQGMYPFDIPESGGQGLMAGGIDFTTSYRRRNVQPRDGLGKLEPERFKFKK